MEENEVEEAIREQEELIFGEKSREERREDAEQLLKEARPIDKFVLWEVGVERNDLAPVLEKVPVYVVPKGSLDPLLGWHYWDIENGVPASKAIFIDEDYATRDIVIHEVCHAKLLNEYPKLYPYLSEEGKEFLVALCERKKL
jgi:hypothetical protein